MTTYRSSRDKSILRLILVPSLISLVVTLWRLTGELLSWSESFFNPEAGGAGAIIGITWLAPVFGIYFALDLLRAGRTPKSWKKAVGLAALGMVVLFAAGSYQEVIYYKSWLGGLAFIWLVALIAASIQLPAWPDLYKTLAAYGLAARVPVILIMFLAFWGGWGTHYDALPPAFPQMSWFANFVLLGLLPQLLFWIAFTIVTGMFFGISAAALQSRRKAVAAEGQVQPNAR